MKRLCSLVLAILVLFVWVLPAQAVETTAEGAVVMETQTKRVLYGQNMHEKLPMASTTKIITAYLTAVHGNLDDIVTVSSNAAGVEGSSLYLKAGDQVSLRTLLYGLMLRSGNDSAVAIAEHVGGSVEGFVSMMNQLAKDLGAQNTHFTNPHGLPDDDHYTTAYDLALITSHALQNKLFAQVVSTKFYEAPEDIKGYRWVLQNKNSLLWSYEGATGVKTGYTKRAGRCLVSSADRDDMEIVCVVLNCYEMTPQSMMLLNYGYENYANYLIFEKDAYLGTVPVHNGILQEIDVYATEDLRLPLTQEEYTQLQCVVDLPKQIDAPFEGGQMIGTIKAMLNGKTVATQSLYTSMACEELTYFYYLQKILGAW
ncbi:MAG: D-alanyl-D-alanine carboxypeptidase family protein [Christensenellales bacterium]|jgi:D-alanyl-D-alanine carboxypeptidase (penicillin-binding protein 5/6)